MMKNKQQISIGLTKFIEQKLIEEAIYRKKSDESREVRLFEWIMEIVHDYQLDKIELCKGYGKSIKTHYGTYGVNRAWYDMRNLKEKIQDLPYIEVKDYGSKYVLIFNF